MSGTTGDHAFLHELELNVRAELALVASGQPQEEAGAEPSEEWLFEEEDAERYEVGLRGLLGAVEGLEDDSGPGIDPPSTELDASPSVHASRRRGTVS